MECIRDKPAHGLLFQATLEELAEFPDEEMEVDVVGKGETPLAKKAAFQRCNGWGWVGFELCGLVLEQRTQLPIASLPRKN